MTDAHSFESWLPVAAFVGLSATFSLVEAIRPLRAVRPFRRGLALDLVGLAIASVVSAIVSGVTLAALASHRPLRAPGLLGLPWMRALLFFVLTDLSRFVTHLWMHRTWMWRFHVFHHTPEQLYWLSGNRVTPAHVVLFTLPTAFLTWALQVGPAVIAANIVLMIFWNHLMHTNARLPSSLQRTMEWIVTTPRYHHIHHVRDPRLHGRNLAALFTVWDHLFRTYSNPDHVDAKKMEFGIDDASKQRSRLRLMIGL